MVSDVKQPPAWWFGDIPAPWWARTLSHVYARVTALRRWLYRRGLQRARKVKVPVIVVGNLIAGGSGKTPLVIALAERLSAAGFNVGIASRGYGRQDPRTPRWVEADTPPQLGGDEPVLIARRSGCKVRVDRDRVAAAQALVKAGCDIVICDDGLQHYRLYRDIEIEVIDGQRGYGNGRLIPAGPLREPLARGQTCQFRVRRNSHGKFRRVLADPRQIRLCGCGIDHQPPAGFIDEIDDEVIDHAAGFVQHARIQRLAGGAELVHRIGNEATQKRAGLRAREVNHAHVADIKHPGGAAHVVVLLHLRTVMERHLPAAKIHHPRTQGAVAGIQWSGFQHEGAGIRGTGANHYPGFAAAAAIPPPSSALCVRRNTPQLAEAINSIINFNQKK